MAIAQFKRCYDLSILATRLQAARIVEEMEHGKTERAKAFAREQETVSAEYWRMKDDFKEAGILDEYDEYEDAMFDKYLNK